MLHNKKILICAHTSIGDNLMMVPFYRFLKQKFNCVITTFSIQIIKEIYDFVEENDHFWSYEQFLNSPKVLLKRIKSEQFDCYLSIFPHRRDDVSEKIYNFLTPLAFQANIPIRIGQSNSSAIVYKNQENTDLINFEYNVPDVFINSLPFSFYPFYLINHTLGVEFNLSYDQIRSMAKLKIPPLKKSRNLIDPNKYTLIMHPGSTQKLIQWPTNHYVSLCHLLKDHDIQIIITGIAEEKKTHHKLCNLEGILDLRGKLSLKETIYLINQADGFFSSSTGPSHIAAALETKIFVLRHNYRNETSSTWIPLTQKKHSIYPPSICNLCKISERQFVDKRPHDFFCECMGLIQPEDAYKLICKNL